MAARNFFVPGSHAFNSNGLAIPGATATLYTTGTTTPAAFYSDSGLSVSLGSTITANGIGRFPTAYGSDAIAYRLILKDAAGAELDGGDIDPFYFGQQIIDLIAPGISPEAYGAVGDGTTDDTLAITAAIAAAAGSALIFSPGKTYKVTSGLTIPDDDTIVYGNGATVTSAMTASSGLLTFSGDRIEVHGLTLALTGGSATPWNLEVQGANCKLLDGCKLTKDEGTAGTVGYLRTSAASGFEMIGCETSGSNGFNCFNASNLLFDGNKFVGKTGGDDAIAIKAFGGNVAENIRIANSHFENLTAFCSLGSEIGAAAANDSTYSNIVRGVQVLGNTGKNCARMLYIKPGANDAVDYRDGTVRGVDFSDNILLDPSGTALNQGVWISAGRGGRVYDVTGKGNKIIGRKKTGASNAYAVWANIRNDGVGTADPVIKGIDVQVDVIDPYDGAASGGSAPGSPWDYAWRIEKTVDGVGTVSDFVIDTTINGTVLGGISVSTGLDNAVLIRRAHMTNIGSGGSSSFGCIDIFSAITVGNDIAMSVAAGSGCVQYKINAGGSVAQQLPQQLAALSVVGNATNALATGTAIAAGSDGQVMRRSGTTIAFGSIDLSASAAVGTSRLTAANLIQGSALSVLGVTGNGTANFASIVGTDGQVLRVSGTALAFGTIATAGIAANAVTYSVFQQVAASSLVGNPTGSLANAQGITLAGGLAFSGTTLTAAGALTPTSVAINGGTALTKAVVYTPSITPSSVAAATVAEQTFTVSGLTTADKVIVNPPSISNATGLAGVRVSAADTLAIRFVNPTAGALTPTSGTYTVLAFRS